MCVAYSTMKSKTEDTHLIPSASGETKCKWRLKKKYCLKSKAAIIILMWNFGVLLIYNIIGNIRNGAHSNSASAFSTTAVGIVTVLAPMAGLLTDVKYSRYKVVLYSSYCLLIEIAALLIIVITIVITKATKTKIDMHHDITLPLYIVSAGVLLVPLLAFMINSIRFGLDQLHDSPTEDSILFIHWYVWVQYLCFTIASVLWNLLMYKNMPALIFQLQPLGLISAC